MGMLCVSSRCEYVGGMEKLFSGTFAGGGWGVSSKGEKLCTVLSEI